MQDINAALDAWAKENEETFKRYDLNTSRLTLSKGRQIWTPYPEGASLHHPGVDFFNSQPLIITRNFAYSKAPEISEKKPNKKMFSFDEKPSDACPKTLKEMIEQSPPLVSMFPKREIAPLQDPRTDVGMLKAGDVSYITVEFVSLSSKALIIEPIMITCFLWDPQRKIRISEMWSFLAWDEDQLKKDKHAFALVNPVWVKAPKKVAFPTSANHQDAVFVVSLDRLVLKGGGSSMMKYYEKTSGSSKSSALSDLSDCNQPMTSMTFAWMQVPVKDVMPKGDPVMVNFDKLLAGHSVSDQFLTEALGAPEKAHDKIVPFVVTLKVAQEQPELPKLRNYFNLRLCPYMSFVNEMIINMVDVRFRFPRGFRGRNVFAQIQCVSEGKALSVFNGEIMYTTRCQYHVEDPHFHEEIIMQLPNTLKPDAQLIFQFFHASVKPKAKNAREGCGTAILPLFTSHGRILKDGLHRVGISYAPTGQVETVQPTDSNRLKVGIQVRSSIFSSDRQVQSLLDKKLGRTDVPDKACLIPNLFGVLDVLIASINKGMKEGFRSMIATLQDFSFDRSNYESQYLVFYLKFCAFRNGNGKDFHGNLVRLWRAYLDEAEFDLKRSDFVCSWFLLELIVKSLMIDSKDADYASIIALCSSLSQTLPSFRNSGQNIGASLNQSIALFCKDLFEFVPHSYVAEIARQHVRQLDITTPNIWFDKQCFRQFMKNLLSPKVFLFFIAPLEVQGSLFTDIFVPQIRKGFGEAKHTNDVFECLYHILSQFGPKEHRIIAPLMRKMFSIVGGEATRIASYQNRSHTVYPIIITHYILYYSDITQISELVAKECSGIIKLCRRLSEQDKQIIKEGPKPAADVMTEAFTAAFRVPEQTSMGQRQTRKHVRSLGSINRNNRAALLSDEPEVDYDQVFDAMTFCIQSLVIAILDGTKTLYTFNNMMAVLCDVDTPPLLKPEFRRCLLDFLQQQKEVIFLDPNSNLKHVIRKLLEKYSPENIQIIETIVDLENSFCRSINRSTALITRALSKVPVTEGLVETMKFSKFATLAEKLYEINKNLASGELRTGNPDVYSDLLFQKAELLSRSPDARATMLLDLTAYHEEMKYFSEAVISQLTVAALVAEYLDKLGRVPHFYEPDTPIHRFTVACPSAASEECPDMVARDMPVIRGFCTSKYFTEYGLIFLIMRVNDMCRRANLFELSTKINNLLSPIAEYRHLWAIMKKYFTTGSFAWTVISTMSTSSDRSLGDYYRIQFQDQGTYIYRETALANLWQVTERIKHSAEFYSQGKPVEVINEGEKLNFETLDKDKYYVHVKAVQQYFTPSDRRKRVTVFEQNHNVSQFYFDIPLTKGSQGGIQDCWLQRTIFTLPHPMPYIVKRVKIPDENIETTVFSPIEYSCESLRKMISNIENACARQDYGNLQMLIQGALLVQVNEGPKRMAEVFLVNADQDGTNQEHCAELRATFRKFLKANSMAVKAHSEYAKKNPCFAVLQEELEAGLNRLTSTLQPYLN